MIHLFRLLMLNISSATNSEKIRIAKENKLHDSSEIKLIFIGIIVFVLSYLVYWVTNNFLLDMKYNILIISYIIASVMVLIDNLNNIKSVLIYKSEDDYLFSLPLTSTEIILSKLFLTYLKNLIYIFITIYTYYIYVFISLIRNAYSSKKCRFLNEKCRKMSKKSGFFQQKKREWLQQYIS